MSRRTTSFDRPSPHLSVGIAFLYGCAAGAVGVAGMTASEKVEQAITRRPSSRVPGLTLARLLCLGSASSPVSTSGSDPRLPSNAVNWSMHTLQGSLVGGVRGVMALHGVRGPFADFMTMAIRLAVDQTLENLTGAGAPPWTWPVAEQLLDLLHKAVFAGVTGWVCDLWVR